MSTPSPTKASSSKPTPYTPSVRCPWAAGTYTTTQPPDHSSHRRPDDLPGSVLSVYVPETQQNHYMPMKPGVVHHVIRHNNRVSFCATTKATGERRWLTTPDDLSICAGASNLYLFTKSGCQARELSKWGDRTAHIEGVREESTGTISYHFVDDDKEKIRKFKRHFGNTQSGLHSWGPLEGCSGTLEGDTAIYSTGH